MRIIHGNSEFNQLNSFSIFIFLYQFLYTSVKITDSKIIIIKINKSLYNFITKLKKNY